MSDCLVRRLDKTLCRDNGHRSHEQIVIKAYDGYRVKVECSNCGVEYERGPSSEEMDNYLSVEV